MRKYRGIIEFIVILILSIILLFFEIKLWYLPLAIYLGILLLALILTVIGKAIARHIYKKNRGWYNDK